MYLYSLSQRSMLKKAHNYTSSRVICEVHLKQKANENKSVYIIISRFL